MNRRYVEYKWLFIERARQKIDQKSMKKTEGAPH